MKNHQITTTDAKNIILTMVEASGSQKSVARQLGISDAYLSDILTGNRPVSDAVARKLGYNKVVMYERISDN